MLLRTRVGKCSGDADVVEGQSHSLVGRCAAGNADVPCQIDVAAGSNSLLQKLVAYRCGADRYYFCTYRSSVGSERGGEVAACRSPGRSVRAVVHLHDETGGIVTVSVLFDVIADAQRLDVFCVGVAQLGHNGHAACAVCNRSGQSAHCTVGLIAARTEVPCSVRGIACEAYAARIHHCRGCRCKAVERSRGIHLAVDAPSCRHSERCCACRSIPHAVEVLLNGGLRLRQRQSVGGSERGPERTHKQRDA